MSDPWLPVQMGGKPAALYVIGAQRERDPNIHSLHIGEFRMGARQGQIPGNGRAKASAIVTITLLTPSSYVWSRKGFSASPKSRAYCTAGTRDNGLWRATNPSPTLPRRGNGCNGLAVGEAERGRGCRDPGPVIKQRRRGVGKRGTRARASSARKTSG